MSGTILPPPKEGRGHHVTKAKKEAIKAELKKYYKIYKEYPPYSVVAEHFGVGEPTIKRLVKELEANA